MVESAAEKANIDLLLTSLDDAGDDIFGDPLTTMMFLGSNPELIPNK